MIRTSAFIAAAAVGVAGAGIALGGTDVLDLVAEGDAGSTAGEVALTDCPDGTVVGVLRPGDRVFATGQNEAGDQVQVTSPWLPGDVAWVARGDLDPDGDLAPLPVTTCGPAEFTLTLPDGEEVVVAAPTTTEPDADTEDADETTTTAPAAGSSVPATTPDAPVATTGPTSTVPATTTTTTTAAPAPTLQLLAPAPGRISERYASGGYSCGDPSSSLIRATTSNATGVTMTWAVAGRSGQVAMTRTGEVWQAVLGSFDENTIASGSATVNITVRATGPGGTVTRTTAVTLDDCTFG